MPVQSNFSISNNTNGGASYGSTPAEIGNTDININTGFPANATNQLYAIAFTKASVVSIFLKSTQPITIKTNSLSSPAQVITLPANEPFVWKLNWAGWFANPIAADVTAFYVTTTASAVVVGHVVTL